MAIEKEPVLASHLQNTSTMRSRDSVKNFSSYNVGGWENLTARASQFFKNRILVGGIEIRRGVPCLNVTTRRVDLLIQFSITQYYNIKILQKWITRSMTVIFLL